MFPLQWCLPPRTQQAAVSDGRACTNGRTNPAQNANSTTVVSQRRMGWWILPRHM